MSQFADRIRQAAREKSTKPFQSTGSSITAQIQAQQTGKAAPAAPTGQSNIAEQVAASAPSQLGQQAQAAGEQMAAQEQQAETQQMAKDAQADIDRKKLESDQMLRTNQILDNAVASDKTMDQREDAAELEQAAFALRLQDKEYNSQLDRIAQEQNLQDEVSFKEAARKELIGQQLESTLKDINFEEKAAASKRIQTWQDALQRISDAESLMNAQIKDQKRAQMIGVATDVAKAGVSSYLEKNKPATDSTKSNLVGGPTRENASKTSSVNFNTVTGFKPGKE